MQKEALIRMIEGCSCLLRLRMAVLDVFAVSLFLCAWGVTGANVLWVVFSARASKAADIQEVLNLVQFRPPTGDSSKTILQRRKKG